MFAPLLTATLLFSASPQEKKAPDKPQTEKEKIEALIKHVEGLKDVKFIRNGTEYSASNAAAFLRGKWDNNAKDIKTAQDFIDKCATKSSTTGQDYIMKMKDGKEKKCAEYLREELKKIEKR
jgi:hypothetical protein